MSKDKHILPAPPNWVEGAVIYQVNTRQFTPEGTFNAFAEHLPRLKELGVDILWFMPVHPIGEKHRKGELGSYYAIRDYREINPEFGNTDDFKRLIEQIHELDMKVMMDLVVNHTAWDHDWVTQHPEWYYQDDDGNMMPGHPEWPDTARLHYDDPALVAEVSAMMQYWVREFDIDGYRCDVAHFVPAHFWETAIPELFKIKPVLMLAESDEPWLHHAGFHMTYSTWLYRRFNDVAKGKRKPSGIVDLLKKERREYPADALRMRFTSNHDENSWLDPAVVRLGPNGAKAFAVLSFTLPGVPLIYNGQEAGIDKRLLFFDKDEIVWLENEYTDLYHELVELYHNTPALHGPDIRFKTTGPVLSFVRGNGKERILSAINLSGDVCAVSINTTRLHGEFTEFFTGAQMSFDDDEFSLTLGPWEYGVWRQE